jgi:hypothetical protein
MDPPPPIPHEHFRNQSAHPEGVCATREHCLIARVNDRHVAVALDRIPGEAQLLEPRPPRRGRLGIRERRRPPRPDGVAFVDRDEIVGQRCGEVGPFAK